LIDAREQFTRILWAQSENDYLQGDWLSRVIAVVAWRWNSDDDLTVNALFLDRIPYFRDVPKALTSLG